MKTQKLLISILVIFAASFGQKSYTDSSQIQITPVSNPVVIKEDSQTLNKALIIRKNPTTWSKIKDLFM